MMSLFLVKAIMWAPAVLSMIQLRVVYYGGNDTMAGDSVEIHFMSSPTSPEYWSTSSCYFQTPQY
jgi:hypothetical protein